MSTIVGSEHDAEVLEELEVEWDSLRVERAEVGIGGVGVEFGSGWRNFVCPSRRLHRPLLQWIVVGGEINRFKLRVRLSHN